jgi:hypothetical protein
VAQPGGRWFAILSEKQILPEAHRSTRELEAASRHYLAVHNQDGNPFVLTKTADQILESVARLVQRISDSGH